MYRHLAKEYGFTPDVVANMTDDQKVMYYAHQEDDPKDLTPEEVLRQAKLIQQSLGL